MKKGNIFKLGDVEICEMNIYMAYVDVDGLKYTKLTLDSMFELDFILNDKEEE